METESAPPTKPPLLASGLALPLPRSYLNFVGRQIFHFLQTIQGVGSFALITLGVTLTKFNVAWRVIHPLIRAQVDRAGVRLLPGIVFFGLVLGLVIVGQTVSLLQKVGAEQYAGTVMVTVLIRELGPLATALVVLARVGTVIVIELGLSRAQGEVEALVELPALLGALDALRRIAAPEGSEACHMPRRTSTRVGWRGHSAGTPYPPA